jgi:hypothetical protein
MDVFSLVVQLCPSQHAHARGRRFRKLKDVWDMQQRYAARVEAPELQSSHQLAGHDLIKRSDIGPIERITHQSVVLHNHASRVRPMLSD